MRIILASQSPRRHEILQYFSIPFETYSPPFLEEAIPFRGDPAEYVCDLSAGKARTVRKIFPKAIVVAADTVVYNQGKIYNKPLNRKEANRFLEEFSGGKHSVFTGVSVYTSEFEESQAEETIVHFNQLAPAQITRYLETDFWKDKAGGYGIQKSGALFVTKIEGCFFNVIGMPINTLSRLLNHAGVDLWNHL